MAETPRETIYLVGTSGHPNYEDEFVTAAWLKHLGEVRPDAEVWLDCPVPGQASHLFSELHPRLRFTDSLFRLVWESRDMPEDEAQDFIRGRVQHLGTPRFDLGLLALRRAGTLHVLGGGYINDRWPFHVGLVQAAAALREVADTSLVATGQGLMPAARTPRLLEALGAFDHVSVRDTPSAELASAHLGPDDAFLGVRELPGFAAQPTEQDGEVWVCLQNDLASPETFDTVVEATRALLTSPEMAGRPIHYVEAMPGIDRVAYDRLSDVIPEDNFLSFVRLWHGEFPARAGQTWITTRSHLHLLAAACGAAGTAVELNDDYDRVKHAALVELGSGWSVTPVGATTLEAPSVSKGFPYKCRTVSQDKLGEAKRLYPPAPKPEPAPPAAAPPEPDKRRGGWRNRW